MDGSVSGRPALTICAAAVTLLRRNHAGRSLAPHLLPREEGPQAQEAGTEPQQVRGIGLACSKRGDLWVGGSAAVQEMNGLCAFGTSIGSTAGAALTES